MLLLVLVLELLWDEVLFVVAPKGEYESPNGSGSDGFLELPPYKDEGRHRKSRLGFCCWAVLLLLVPRGAAWERGSRSALCAYGQPPPPPPPPEDAVGIGGC